MAKYRVEMNGETYEVEYGAESVVGGIAKSAARGLMKGGASMLETEQAATNIAANLINRIPGVNLAPPSQIYGDLANRANQFIEQRMPQGDISGSIPGLITEGLGQVPSMVAQTEMLGGGVKGLGALGALQGSKEGPLGAAAGGLLGLAQGGILKAASGLNVVPRAAIGAGTFAAPAALNGAPPKEVIAQAALGAGFSGIRPGALKELVNFPKEVGETIQNFGRAKARTAKIARNLFRDPRLPLMEQVKRQIGEERRNISGVQNQFRQIQEQRKADLLGRASGLTDILDARIAEQRAETTRNRLDIKKSVEATRASITKQVSELDRRLANEADIASVSTQQKLSDFFRGNSKAYGREYDAVANEIDNSNSPITLGEVNDILNRAETKSVVEADVKSGAALDRIRSLKAKYAIDRVDAQGNIISGDPSKQILFKEFRKDIKSVDDAVKSLGRQGKRFSPDEIPAAILKSEVGEYLATLSDSFAQLQESYRPVISYMNKAAAVFRPYQGEAYSGQGAKLIERYALGSADPSESRLINFLQKGTEKFGGGIGNVSASAKQVADNIGKLRGQLDYLKVSEADSMLNLAKNEADRISALSKRKELVKQALDNEKEKAAARILQEKAAAEMKIFKRIEQLQGRKDKVQLLKMKQKKLNRIANGVLVSMGALGIQSYLASLAARGILRSFEASQE